MKQLRKHIISWLFDKSQKVYTQLFKHHKAWGISRDELLQLPEETLGWHLGDFLRKNDFQLIAKVERHDAYHTLTGYGTAVEDEIALQYLCFGNGKRSPYLLGAMILGSLILPDYLTYYRRSYRIGTNAHPFHQFDYKKLLRVNLHDFRKSIFSQQELAQLKLRFPRDDSKANQLFLTNETI